MLEQRKRSIKEAKLNTSNKTRSYRHTSGRGDVGQEEFGGGQEVLVLVYSPIYGEDTGHEQGIKPSAP